MKKIIWTFLFMMTVGLMVGCHAADKNTEAGEVTITISEDNQETMIAEKTVELGEEITVLELLKKHFDVEEEQGGFITSIEGVTQNVESNHYWIYEVNGEAANVGAGDYELEPNDEVNFDLQEVQY